MPGDAVPSWSGATGRRGGTRRSVSGARRRRGRRCRRAARLRRSGPWTPTAVRGRWAPGRGREGVRGDDAAPHTDGAVRMFRRFLGPGRRCRVCPGDPGHRAACDGAAGAPGRNPARRPQVGHPVRTALMAPSRSSGSQQAGRGALAVRRRPDGRWGRRPGPSERLPADVGRGRGDPSGAARRARGSGAAGRQPTRFPITVANESGSPSNPRTAAWKPHAPVVSRVNSATTAAVAAWTPEKSSSERSV